MALTFGRRATVTIPLLDATGSTAQIRLQVRVNALADLEDVTTTIVNNLNNILALTGGSARTMTISLPWSDPTPPAALAGSRVEKIGQWLVGAAGGRTGTISIPALRDTLVDAIGYVARTNPAVQAFETFLLNDVVLPDGTDITSVLDAREVFKSSGRRAPRLRR